ncbi:Protein CBG22379 [Caenorhabditis briggsae]|uniref:WD repeat-containing protein 89 n=2 Tax=Caenorhabditis briggsae TaxID=6238 RepID=A0AAE9A904_CAEBR|nr:Protein CBG22379 [Caenorhabditis briggsae]ULT93678.1 hypothetical protein L3Y34_003283 [Caenorhabditis briggsae]CAP38982.1 Protein CBG22379 [Caenorhabditis briggsae]
MPGKIDLSPNASVRMISVNTDNVACAYLANLYIPIFSLEKEKVLRRYEVHNQISGIHFAHAKKNVIYAVDDSFGLHVFDIRSESKKKFRLNPECENHNVVSTAFSSNDQTIAVSSSTFAGGISDVRGSRRRQENHENVISLYDARYPTNPITTYYKRHKSSVTTMEFYQNGDFLITGDSSGAIKSFDCQLRDEDNACRWERWTTKPISKVGIINKRIVYGMSGREEATVFYDSKGSLEVLYGSVSKTENGGGDSKRSNALFKKPEWCIGLIKGVNDDIPLVAVHGVAKETFISLTAINQEGHRQSTPLLSYEGHSRDVKCMTATSEFLLTGGDDGKVVVQIANFKNPKFGSDALPNHHPLILNRAKLAEIEDYGNPTSSEASEDVVRDSEAPSSSESSKKTSSSSSLLASESPKPEKSKFENSEDSTSSESANPLKMCSEGKIKKRKDERGGDAEKKEDEEAVESKKPKIEEN